MGLIRRAFFIEEAQDELAGNIAETLEVNKSELIDLALARGLERIGDEEIGDVVREITERRLRRVGKGSISKISAKRRSK